MKRNLTALAILGLSLVANAASASEWAFDEAYWKRAETVQNAQAQHVHDQAQPGRYDQVDRYNP
jgi:hypothetical protein